MSKKETKIEIKSKIINALNDFFIECSLFNKLDPFYTDFNDEDPNNFSLNKEPGSVFDSDIIGNRIFIENYSITSRKYTTDNLERIENLSFTDMLSEWIDLQNYNGIYPVLGKDIEVDYIRVVDNGYLYQNDNIRQIGVYTVVFQIKYTKLIKKILGGN